MSGKRDESWRLEFLYFSSRRLRRLTGDDYELALPSLEHDAHLVSVRSLSTDMRNTAMNARPLEGFALAV